MADDTLIPVTEADVKDQNLLFRTLKKIVMKLLSLGTRISTLETAPLPPTVQSISRDLQASGPAPLNVAGLPGMLAQPQLAGAPTLSSAPTGQVLQQYKDTQLLVVGTTSTGYVLYQVKGGNPNLLSNLSSGFIAGSNLMTLDTVQTSTGAKTLQGIWNFSTNVGYGSASPLYAIDVYRTGMQLHASTSTDDGFYAGTIGVSGGAIAGGCQFDGTNWIGKDASAAAVRVDSASVEGYTNTALTTGNVFTPTRRFRADSGGMIIDQTVYIYNGINTVGQGLTVIVASVDLTNQGASIGATNLLAAAPAGMYRAALYIDTSTVGAAGTVTATISWNDGDSAESVTTGAVSLVALAGDFTTLNQVLRSAAAQNITYSTTVAGAVGAPKYHLAIVLERMT